MEQRNKTKYVVNPYTGRNVKVGSRIYKNLVNSGAFKKSEYESDDSISEESSSSQSSNSIVSILSEDNVIDPKNDLTQEERELIIELANQLK